MDGTVYMRMMRQDEIACKAQHCTDTGRVSVAQALTTFFFSRVLK